MTVTKIRVPELTRPANVPENWQVWTAPRPLYGTQVWKDGFHFAAIDPTDKNSNMFIEENCKLKADILEYVTPAEMREWVKAFCKSQGYEFTESDNDLVTYLYNANNGTEQIEL